MNLSQIFNLVIEGVKLTAGDETSLFHNFSYSSTGKTDNVDPGCFHLYLKMDLSYHQNLYNSEVTIKIRFDKKGLCKDQVKFYQDIHEVMKVLLDSIPEDVSINCFEEQKGIQTIEASFNVKSESLEEIEEFVGKEQVDKEQDIDDEDEADDETEEDEEGEGDDDDPEDPEEPDDTEDD